MKKKTKKSKMTLDNLATLVQGEFLQVGKKINVLENRFDTLEKKVDDGFSRIDAHLDTIERDIKTLLHMKILKILWRELNIWNTNLA